MACGLIADSHRKASRVDFRPKESGRDPEGGGLRKGGETYETKKFVIPNDICREFKRYL